MKKEIILFENQNAKLEVNMKDEIVCLNREQLAMLFAKDIKTIGKHINNALNEELDNSVVAKFATTANDGKTYQVEYYNLDMTISVGYRVKSQNGVIFRKWANKVLKDYMMNYQRSLIIFIKKLIKKALCLLGLYFKIAIMELITISSIFS